MKNGIYVVSDYNNQETLMKVTNTDKSIKFELVGDIPRFTRGNIDEFIYNQKDKKRTINKIRSGHAIDIINEDKFVLYPYQSGNPYLFIFKSEVE